MRTAIRISGAACGPLTTGWVSDDFVSTTCIHMYILHVHAFLS